MKKIFAIILCLILALGVFSGCEDKGTYDDYSYGLDSNGLYVNIEKYNVTPPDFSNTTYKCEDVLSWGVEYLNSASEEPVYGSVDDYVRQYAKEFLASLGVASRDVVKDGDICSLTLSFYIDEEHLEDYDSTANHKADAAGDVIVSSLIGHNVGDEYSVKYTFDDDSEYYAGKTADVSIKINSISIGDPLSEGVVENNLDEISKYLDGVTDTESFLNSLKPQIARTSLDMFISDQIQQMEEFDPPEEYIDYEMYRLKARLQQLGYGYKEYLELSDLTEEEVYEYCKTIAKENYVCMLIYNNAPYKVTDEVVKENFGENYEYLVEIQGLPYLKLRMIRDYTLLYAANDATLTFNGEVVDFGGESMVSEYENTDNNTEVDDDSLNDTQETVTQETVPSETSIENTETLN